MNQNVIVISVNQYRITNDKTGEVENEGCTVRYLMSDSMSHIEDKQKSVKGHRPAKANMPVDDYHKFPTVPGLYEVTYSNKVASDGKVSLTPTEFKFLSDIAIGKPVNMNLKAKQQEPQEQQ